MHIDGCSEKHGSGNHGDNPLAFLPLNSYEQAHGEPLPKYVIDKSCLYLS